MYVHPSANPVTFKQVEQVSRRIVVAVSRRARIVTQRQSTEMETRVRTAIFQMLTELQTRRLA